MNLLERIARRIGYVKKQSRSAPLLMNPFTSPGQPEARPINFEDLEATYSVSVWVYACVFQIAACAAQVPFRLFYQDSSGQWSPLSSSPLLNLLQRPNPFMSSYDLFEATFSFLELTGNAYWELVADDEGEVREIYLLRPDRMEVVPHPQNYIQGYLYSTPSGKKVAFEAHEVLHFKYFNPLNDYYGLSPLKAAELSVIVDLQSATYNRRFFENGARPDGILKTDQSLSQQAFERLREQFMEAHGGLKKSHRLAILEEGLHYLPISLNAKDMDFIKQREMSREEILAAFGVPPVMVGIFRYANYANSYEQKKSFWEETMLGKLRKVEAQLNSTLIGPYGQRNGYLLKGFFDVSQVEALKENEEQRARILTQYVQNGIMSVMEARESLGLEA